MTPEHRMELIDEFDRIIDIAEREAYNQAIGEVLEVLKESNIPLDVCEVIEGMKLEDAE